MTHPNDIRDAIAAAIERYRWICLESSSVARLPAKFCQRIKAACVGKFPNKMAPGHRAIQAVCNSQHASIPFHYRVTSSKMGSYKYLQKYQAVGIMDQSRSWVLLIVGSEKESIIPAVSASRNVQKGPFLVFKNDCHYQFILAGKQWARAEECDIEWPKADFALQLLHDGAEQYTNNNNNCVTHHDFDHQSDDEYSVPQHISPQSFDTQHEDDVEEHQDMEEWTPDEAPPSYDLRSLTIPQLTSVKIERQRSNEFDMKSNRNIPFTTYSSDAYTNVRLLSPSCAGFSPRSVSNYQTETNHMDIELVEDAAEPFDTSCFFDDRAGFESCDYNKSPFGQDMMDIEGMMAGGLNMEGNNDASIGVFDQGLVDSIFQRSNSQDDSPMLTDFLPQRNGF